MNPWVWEIPWEEEVKSLSRVRLFPRPLRPWDSPGKNIGVGCHFLLQGNLPYPGIEPRSPTLQADALTSEPLGKPHDNPFCIAWKIHGQEPNLLQVHLPAKSCLATEHARTQKFESHC